MFFIALYLLSYSHGVKKNFDNIICKLEILHKLISRKKSIMKAKS